MLLGLLSKCLALAITRQSGNYSNINSSRNINSKKNCRAPSNKLVFHTSRFLPFSSRIELTNLTKTDLDPNGPFLKRKRILLGTPYGAVVVR